MSLGLRWPLLLFLGLGPWACGSGDGGLGPPDGAADGDGADVGDDGADGGLGGDGAGECPRRVLEGQVTNARDLGGWPLAGGARVACRRLLRGGTLVGLDAAGCDAFAALGIRTVVDLRDPGTQAASPPPACVTATARVVQAPLPKLLPDSASTYLALLDEGASIRAAFEALAGQDALPGYLHCEIGRARASVLTALVLSALGAERATVLEEFALSSQAGVEVSAAHLAAVLDEVEAQGGVEAYLLGIGVPAATLEALRLRAREEL
jgi:hypothetical protein